MTVLPTAKETRIGPRNYQSVHRFPIYFSSEDDSFAEGQGRDLPTRFRSKLTITSKNQIGIRNAAQGRNQSVMVLLRDNRPTESNIGLCGGIPHFARRSVNSICFTSSTALRI